jgi:hypothetical protein
MRLSGLAVSVVVWHWSVGGVNPLTRILGSQKDHYLVSPMTLCLRDRLWNDALNQNWRKGEMHKSEWGHFLDTFAVGRGTVAFDLCCGTGCSGLACLERGMKIHLVDQDLTIKESAMNRLLSHYYYLSKADLLPTLHPARMSCENELRAQLIPNNPDMLRREALWMEDGKKSLVEVRETTKLAGPWNKGVFAKCDLKKGYRVGWYRGLLFLKKTSPDLPNFSNRVITCGNHLVMASLLCGVGYANDAHGIADAKNNAMFCSDDESIYLKTTSAIKKDQEVLVDYGEEWWAEMEKVRCKHANIYQSSHYSTI